MTFSLGNRRSILLSYGDRFAARPLRTLLEGFPPVPHDDPGTTVRMAMSTGTA